VFSNSDHLQAQTALVADYFGLPGKDWRFALRAKNKALMRRRLAETGREQVTAVEIPDLASLDPARLGYPVVLKPAEGVASEDVVLVTSPAELRARCGEIFGRRPGERLLAEEYLPDTLRTLETLSDGVTTLAFDGFRSTVSPPPFFIEERLTWDGPASADVGCHILGALRDLGGGGLVMGAQPSPFGMDLDLLETALASSPRKPRRPLAAAGSGCGACTRTWPAAWTPRSCSASPRACWTSPACST
jgi:hypothetical protein